MYPMPGVKKILAVPELYGDFIRTLRAVQSGLIGQLFNHGGQIQVAVGDVKCHDTIGFHVTQINIQRLTCQ